MNKRVCKDCVAENLPLTRDAKYPGPRCRSHHLLNKKRTSARAHELHIARTFELPAGAYHALYESQGGLCFICRRARGIAKRLAVDHEHGKPGCTHPPERGCPKCVRALLCSECNKTIGRLNPEALARAITVLTDPPARKVLAGYGAV